MKKTVIFFFITLVAFSFLSCATTSGKLNQMRKICVQIEENNDFTKKEFNSINTRFTKIVTQLESRNLDDDEKNELTQLKGRYYGALTAKVTKNMNNIYEGLGNAIKGFLEGVNNSIDQ